MDRIGRIFTFQEQLPMIFTRVDFWLFFLLAFAGFVLLHRRLAVRNAYLMLASWFFYYNTSGTFLLLLIVSILTGFLFGRIIHGTETAWKRKVWIGVTVTIQLFFLVYFKYAYFFADIASDILGREIGVMNHFAVLANTVFHIDYFDVDRILLPVGISFFTFQVLTYVVDIYRKQLEPVRSFTDFAFYVSFFPQLVAGPIVRASQFIPQLRKESILTKEQFGAAMFMILKGLFKKIFIGDYIAVNFVDRVFGNPESYTGLENIFALIGYSLQVYVDFSGYTDIAIGLSLLMGFTLARNFNSPYKAQNVGDFWRRWHISLSTFLRDYLYIPLGGNRNGNTRTNVNLMITMLLGGLWHGASWNFAIWGGVNGIGLLVYKWWKRHMPWKKSEAQWAMAGRILWTFIFITFTRIWFRAPDLESANAFFKVVGSNMGWGIFPEFVVGFKWVLLVMALGFFTHWLSNSFKDKWRDRFAAAPLWVQVLITVVVVVIIYQSVSADMQPFIYFQF
jgi:alginate O-acetyltransferase complex protein AlgI